MNIMEEDKEKKDLKKKGPVSCLKLAHRRLKTRDSETGKDESCKITSAVRYVKLKNEIKISSDTDEKIKEMQGRLIRYRRKCLEYRTHCKNLNSLNLELTEKLNEQKKNLSHSLNLENMQEKLFAKDDVIKNLKLQLSKLTAENEQLRAKNRESQIEIASLKDTAN